jgi:hypothetical protein
MPMVPEYAPLEPFPAGVPDAMLEGYTKRFEDLADYFTSEHARLSAFVERTQTGIQDSASPLPLAPGPRAVPFSYLLAETMRGYWIVLRWALFPPITMVVSMGMGASSIVHPLVSLAPLVPLGIYAAARAKRRIAVLRSGEVAEILSRTVRYAGGRMTNWPMTFTRGWKTEVRTYTGSSSVTHFQFRTSRGAFGQVSVSGVEYDGVIVADPERPELAFGVTDFGSMPRPGAQGQWDPSLPLRVWAATLLALALVFAWVGAAVLMTLHEVHLFD